MSELAELVAFLSNKTKAHICIHDISCLLSQESLQLDFRQKIHSTAYCDAAKSTPRGYRLCIRCKELANRKSVVLKKPFWGICPYGILEIVNPVVIDGAVACIIYIGNILPNQQQHRTTAERACRLTGVPQTKLENLLHLCEPDPDIDYYIQMSELLKNAICLMRKERNTPQQRHRSLIGNVEEYILFHYAQNITLKDLAKLYFINEKYLGRLFHANTGRSFHQYLNQIRLEHAVSLLENTTMSILNIALECGYSNITYFNRIFYKNFHLSPSQYRTEKKNVTKSSYTQDT